jgi:hypothetical protein
VLGLLAVLGTSAAVAASFAFGFGLLGSRLVDLEAGRAASRAECVVAQTMNLLTASPLDEIEGLHGTSMSAAEAGGLSTWRIEFAVSALPTGYRVDATLVDTETREAMRQFVAWRGRT